MLSFFLISYKWNPTVVIFHIVIFSLNIIPWRFIQVVICAIAHSFLLLCNIPCYVCMYWRSSGSFQCWVIKAKVSMNICEPKFYFLVENACVWLLSHRMGSYLFLWKTAQLSSWVAMQYYISISNIWVIQFICIPASMWCFHV